MQATARPAIFNGTYTVISTSGDHRTFRVHTWKDAETPTRSVGLLIGSNNETDYQDFGFVRDDGRIVVWKKHRGGQLEKLARLLEDLFSAESRWRARGFRVEESLTCLRCNRRLTTKESLALGYGSECAQKLGY